MSPTSFYALTIQEANLILDGHSEQLQVDYNLFMTAMYNANGVFHGGKKFKMLDPFSKDEKKKSKKSTIEERNATLDFLNKKFNNQGRE